MSNIRPYVIINGVDSRTIQGLLITSLPPISKPAQRTLTETIDGRDGDSSVKLGYSAYDKSLGIALTFGYNVDDVISFFNSEGTIVFSNEPDKLYNFEIFEQIDLEKLIRFKTGTVTIHTQPFKFSTTENPLEFTEKEFTVVNNGNIESRPNIVVTGEGLATMQINGKNALNIDFGDAEQTLLIDSEGMNAYHTENIKKVEAEITPKQDLHGYDHPWAAGGGKNLFNASEDNITDGANICTISGSVITNTGANAYDAVRFEQPLKDGNYVLHASNISANGILQVQYYDSSYHDLGYMSRNSPTLTFTMPANTTLRISLYSSQAGGMSVTELQCELGSTPSAFEPYSNICPLVGHSELNLTRCGVNLWDEEWELGTINTQGEDTPANDRIRSKNYTPVTAGEVYSITTPNALNFRFYRADKSFLSYTSASSTITIPSKCAFMRFVCPNVTEYANNISINYPSSITGYNAYNGNTFTVAFGQTVYGGVYDKSGRLTITHGYILVDDNTPTLQYNGSTGESVKAYFDCTGKANGNLNIISDRFVTRVDNQVGNVRGRENTNGVEFSLPLTVTPTTAGVKQWFADNNTELVFELATPIVIELDPETISALLGINNFYADTGEVTITFVNDGQDETQTGAIVTFDLDESDFNRGDLAKRLVSGNYDNIRLKAGANSIKFTGSVSAVGFNKYSRWL